MYDCIVIGSGIVGSFTAYHLSKHGANLLLLDQFPLPHSRGSSHGQSRIIRHAYGPRRVYSDLMPESFKTWFDIERQSGNKLYHKTGTLIASNESCTTDEWVKGLKSGDQSHERYNKDQLKNTFPDLNLPEYDAVMDVESGILQADLALQSVQSLVRRFGGVIHDRERVVDILDSGGFVEVVTDKEIYKSRKVVLTVGSWINKLLSPLGLTLPLEPLRVAVTYYRKKTPDSFNFPHCFIDVTHMHHTYFIPEFEYPGLVKALIHGGVACDPDNRDAVAHLSTSQIELSNDFVRQYLPGLHPEPVITESCMYTQTPDSGFVIDRHPKLKNVIIGTGFSGHGFKCAPVTGRLLMELVLDLPPSFPLQPFSLFRLTATGTEFIPDFR